MVFDHTQTMNGSRGVGQEAASLQDGDRLEDTEESGLSDALGLLHIEIDCETAVKFGGDGEEILRSVSDVAAKSVPNGNSSTRADYLVLHGINWHGNKSNSIILKTAE